jgi:hypothetical protein
MKDTVTVTAEIHRLELMKALRDLTVNTEDFDFRQWSIWDAEVLERIARMIRDGYNP